MDYGFVVTQMEKTANEFLEKAYGFKLDIPIVINGRLKSVFGRFVYNAQRKEPLRIEMSKNYVTHQKATTVEETLIHELIHYALFVQNLPFNDGHPYFEAELKKWGSHSSGTVKYKGKTVVYGCPSCNAKFRKKKRYPKNRRYVSSCCNKAIVFLGEEVV